MELPNPSNGEVVYTSRLNGSEALFKCSEGYILSGANRTTCLSNPDTVLGDWSAASPVCNSKNIRIVIMCNIYYDENNQQGYMLVHHPDSQGLPKGALEYLLYLFSC